jgi:hypothetical protein
MPAEPVQEHDVVNPLDRNNLRSSSTVGQMIHEAVSASPPLYRKLP